MALGPLKRLKKELQGLQKGGDPDILLAPQEDNIRLWKAFIRGPPETPFDGGVFELKIEVGSEYPIRPPSIKFVTKIFHPNIHFDTGEICLDILKKEWSPAWSLQAACRAVVALLSAHAADSPLNCDAGNMVRANDLLAFNSVARMYTIEFANKPFPTGVCGRRCCASIYIHDNRDCSTGSNITTHRKTILAAMEEMKENSEPASMEKPGSHPVEEEDSSDEENMEPDELYDEGEDDANEKWVEKHLRKGRHGPTDAYLSCPCCFTTVCMDCQRHATVKTQFRAMFTFNCAVQAHTRVSSHGQGQSKDQGKKRKGGSQSSSGAQQGGNEAGGDEEVLHPVVCSSCGTMLGVQDSDEVVHFHNVLEG